MRIEKKVIKELYLDRLRNSGFAVICGYQKLKVQDLKELRQTLAGVSSTCNVVKNHVLRMALEELECTGAARCLEGQNALITGSDVAGAAREIKNFAATRPDLVVKGGFIGKAFFDPARLTAVASLPPRPVLLSQLLAAMQSPISGLVGVWQGILREFPGTLQAVADKRAKA